MNPFGFVQRGSSRTGNCNPITSCNVSLTLSRPQELLAPSELHTATSLTCSGARFNFQRDSHHNTCPYRHVHSHHRPQVRLSARQQAHNGFQIWRASSRCSAEREVSGSSMFHHLCTPEPASSIQIGKCLRL
jgi:hypothetical protein